MWDLKELKRKRKEVLKRLENCTDIKEKGILELTLLTYINMINDYYLIYNKDIYYAFKYITKSDDLITTKKEKKYIFELGKLIKQRNFISKEYLDLLSGLALNLFDCLKDYYKEVNIDFNKINLSNKELIDICKDFYLDLDDKEISDTANKILDNDKALIICSPLIGRHDFCAGISYSDHIYNDTYCIVTIENSINDILVLAHEIMHGVDFLIKPKSSFDNYRGFGEVPAIVIEYLMIDYLSKNGFDQSDIEKLRYVRLRTILYKAMSIYFDVYLKKDDLSKNLRDNLSDAEQRKLVEVEAEVIAYGLYKQIKEDKLKGLDNLKKFIKEPTLAYEKPDFSFIDLDELSLLDLSKEIGLYYKGIIDVKKKVRSK